MFVETIKSEGLAHLSYLVGDQDQAAVIDPRRDCEIYLRKAAERQCRITHIFETHRNEDLVSGSPVLAKRTGADVFHGSNGAEKVLFAEEAREGDRYRLGDLLICVLETPGHTDDSLSFVLHDSAYGHAPVGVFTGDALFVGDVGRTDFYPDRAEEVAGALYDSLQKLFELGDGVIVYPAHGAGSVCGDEIAGRDFSTLGYERRHNDAIRGLNRDGFIRRKLAERHQTPPYFQLMECLNREGSRRPEQRLLETPVLTPFETSDLQESVDILDVRGVTDFLGAHPPGALCLPTDLLPSYAGWLLDPDRRLLLIAGNRNQAVEALRHLYRIGFDHVCGMMLAPMTDWAASALPFVEVPALDTGQVKQLLQDRTEGWTLLDVRKPNETGAGMIPGAKPLFLGELPGCLDGFKKDQRITVTCTSGARATIGASLLLRQGFNNVDVYLGSMDAWSAKGQPKTAPAQA